MMRNRSGRGAFGNPFGRMRGPGSSDSDRSERMRRFFEQQRSRRFGGSSSPGDRGPGPNRSGGGGDAEVTTEVQQDVT